LAISWLAVTTVSRTLPVGWVSSLATMTSECTPVVTVSRSGVNGSRRSSA
jgi:hypothetical protein